jgi:5-methyltetrahydropteroyltriglutamate--homocysteine methyltransferase
VTDRSQQPAHRVSSADGATMKLSEDRFLTTHTGSLPRPQPLERLMFAKLDDEPFDEDRLAAEVRDAVHEAVRRQAASGIDIVCDGEMSREGMHYVRDHMEGFGGESTEPRRGRDIVEHPDAAQKLRAQSEGFGHMRSPACTGPIKYRDLDWLKTDIETFRAALEAAPVEEGFVTVTSPGTIAQIIENQHYESRDAYLMALADAVKVQCDAIVDAGFLLQVDAPDLAMEWHISFYDLPPADVHRLLETNVEAYNRAVADVPRDRIRLHVCWGNYAGPHTHDVAVEEIMNLVLASKAGGITFPAANPRHEHEWRAWENADIPDDTVLIPGVIDTLSPLVEHPQLVTDRIERWARIVPRENLIPSTDCGFGTFVGLSSVAPSVAYEKLATLGRGARVASDRLF